LEAATMAEKTDEKLGEDGKRRFNFMLGRHSHHWNMPNKHGFSL
jgi:hypothetical protein